MPVCNYNYKMPIMQTATNLFLLHIKYYIGDIYINVLCFHLIFYLHIILYFYICIIACTF